MCGIAGFCLNEKHKVRPAEVASQMLLDIEHRGTDATGMAFISTKTGQKVVNKKAVPATVFIQSGHSRCKNVRTMILHTRYATQGSPKNSHNNHPITRGKITLTHNGHCQNDKALFKQLNVSRIGQVDSEAIVALIAYGKGTITERLEMIEGNAALAWIESKEPNTLHLARVRTSPLWVGQSREGSLFYGSTKQTVENASIIAECELDWVYEMKEGEYLRIVNGSIVEMLKFTPKPIVYSYKQYDQMGWLSTYDDYYLTPSPKKNKKEKWKTWDDYDYDAYIRRGNW
jgi:glucosamine 6-phosphate synthetase-like amidotransferase/phosphosugar isomerase protein